MKKGTIRLTAGSIAMAMLFSGCGNSVASFASDYDKYVNSDVVQVKDKEILINGKTGAFTGDWKGDRPEGYGECAIGENEFCKGTWENGYLSGQGEMSKEEDGVLTVYEGEFALNNPCGVGVMTITSDDSESKILVKGTFGEGYYPLYFSLDEEGRLVDIGSYDNGTFITFIDNYDYQGMSYIPESLKQPEREFNGGIGNIVECTQYGEYYGEIDNNGLPNGYGYLRLYDNYSWPDGAQNQTLDYLAEWKNGECDGLVTYYMHSSSSNTVYEEVQESLWDILLGNYTTKAATQTQTIDKKVIGSLKGDNFIGENTFYTNTVHEPAEYDDGLVISKTYFVDENTGYYDLREWYSPYNDGTYRTPEERKEYYYTDGRTGYESRTYILDNKPSDQINMVSYDRIEGEYCFFDSDGNVIDYGVPSGTSWAKLDPPKDYTELRNALIALGIGAVAIKSGLALADSDFFSVDTDKKNFDSSDWCQSFYDACEAERKADEDSYFKRKELLEKAEEARKLGNEYDARKYENEADQYSGVIF